MLIFPKSDGHKLCEGLDLKELRCKCKHNSCRATIIDPYLIDAYHYFRVTVNIPLKINSGFRCVLHNFNEGGKPESRHIMGQAIDISLSRLLKKFTRDEIKDIAYTSGFTYVKFYVTFVHLDVRE